MSTRRPTEIKAIVALLEQDWESPEDLAWAMIQTLDETRKDRDGYVAVLQFSKVAPSYLAMGPYPTRKAAQKALEGHPAASEAVGGVVAHLRTPANILALVEDLGKGSESARKMFKDVADDVVMFRQKKRRSA